MQQAQLSVQLKYIFEVNSATLNRQKSKQVSNSYKHLAP